MILHLLSASLYQEESNQNYKNQLTNVFNEKFPNEILRTDLISQVNNLVSLSDKYKFISKNNNCYSC